MQKDSWIASILTDVYRAKNGPYLSIPSSPVCFLSPKAFYSRVPITHWRHFQNVDKKKTILCVISIVVSHSDVTRRKYKFSYVIPNIMDEKFSSLMSIMSV